MQQSVGPAALPTEAACLDFVAYAPVVALGATADVPADDDPACSVVVGGRVGGAVVDGQQMDRVRSWTGHYGTGVRDVVRGYYDYYYVLVFPLAMADRRAVVTGPHELQIASRRFEG